MCIILFSWNSHPDYSLVVAANRDEFYERPTKPIHWWDNHEQILGSRDAADVIGIPGTALGMTLGGKFSALTNIRAPSEKNPDLRTRGELTAKYLSTDHSIDSFMQDHQKSMMQYNGFNLLMADLSDPHHHELAIVSNRILVGDRVRQRKMILPQRISPGVYGLSNAMLDTPWPKVRNGIAKFAQALAMDTGTLNHPEHYFQFLRDETTYPDEQLPATGVNLEWERALAPIFIQTDQYGTRSSSLLRIRKDGVFQMIERRFNAAGEEETSLFEGQLNRSAQVDR